MSRLVLVTGGAGFIGSHLVDALLARGDRVRVLDDFSTGRRANLAHCLADIELLEGDVRDPGLVARAVAGCDGVLHEAAVASVPRSLEDPVGTGSVTHGGTVSVARLARRAGAGALVLASSCAVYGEADALPISEDAPTRPDSPYALAKLLSEGVCRSGAFGPARGPYGAQGGSAAATRAVCLRYFNVYGPRQDPSSPYSGVISRFVEVAARREDASLERRMDEAPPFTVDGDGRQSRDFVFVADVVRANLLALDACLREDDAGQADGAVVNVGSGVQVEVLEIAAQLERLIGGGSDEADGPSAGAPLEFRAARRGDIRASQADIARARRVFGYEPAVGFADGLAATYRAYRAAAEASPGRASESPPGRAP